MRKEFDKHPDNPFNRGLKAYNEKWKHTTKMIHKSILKIYKFMTRVNKTNNCEILGFIISE